MDGVDARGEDPRNRLRRHSAAGHHLHTGVRADQRCEDVEPVACLRSAAGGQYAIDVELAERHDRGDRICGRVDGPMEGDVHGAARRLLGRAGGVDEDPRPGDVERPAGQQCSDHHAAGAEFVVSPGLTENVAHAASRLGVPFLGEVPLTMDVRESSDAGSPVVGHDVVAPELKFMVELGIKRDNYDALRSATVIAAQVSKLGGRLGTLEPGKEADVIVVDGNPLETLDELERVRMTFVAGKKMIGVGD